MSINLHITTRSKWNVAIGACGFLVGAFGLLAGSGTGMGWDILTIFMGLSNLLIGLEFSVTLISND